MGRSPTEALMGRHIAFLGGLNVGKGHRVSMADLKAHFEALGYDDVSTYINSGNVVFSTSKPKESAIEGALEKELGFAVPTFVRTAAAVAELTSPFGEVDGTVLVGFLKTAPTAAVKKAVTALATPADTLEVHGTELWWHLPNGQMGSKLPRNWGAEADLGPMTTRNLNMLQKLAAKLD